MRRKRWRRCIDKKWRKLIKSAEGSTGLLHKIFKHTAWRGGAQILKKQEEDARLLDCCEAKRKEWAKHWQRDGSVQNMEDKPWENEELKKTDRLHRCSGLRVWRHGAHHTRGIGAKRPAVYKQESDGDDNCQHHAPEQRTVSSTGCEFVCCTRSCHGDTNSFRMVALMVVTRVRRCAGAVSQWTRPMLTPEPSSLQASAFWCTATLLISMTRRQQVPPSK